MNKEVRKILKKIQRIHKHQDKIGEKCNICGKCYNVFPERELSYNMVYLRLCEKCQKNEPVSECIELGKYLLDLKIKK